MIESAWGISRAINLINPYKGKTLWQVDQEVRRLLPGFISGPEREYKFPGFSCISPKEVICHGIPKKNYQVLQEDIVKVDVAAKSSLFHGYADMCWSFLVGRRYSSLWIRSYLCTWFILRNLNQVKKVNDLVSTCRYYSKKFGLTIVREFGGHFIGRKMHEGEFFIPYLDLSKVNINLTNKCFTIEPIYTDNPNYNNYLPEEETRFEHRLKSNQGTFVMFEHMVYLTDKGSYILSFNMKRQWCIERRLPYLNFYNPF